MNKRLFLGVATALLAVPAFATTNTDDGLSYNFATGGTGHFDGVMHGGAYPYTLTSPLYGGWSQSGTPTQFYAATRGAYNFLGVYDYDDYNWILASGTAPTITVIADFELWYSEHGDASEVYFHQGAGLSQSQSVTIAFSGDGNNGEWWGISKGTWGSGDILKASQLAFLEDGFGRTGSYGGNPVPLTWEFSDNGGATWQLAGPGNWSGGNGQTDWGFWWLLNGGNLGPWNWLLRVTINPDQRQKDGRYYLDPFLVARPSL